MKQENQSLLHVINNFMTLLDTLEDSRESVYEFRSILRTLIRIKYKENSLPVIEFVSLIKARKPNVYYFLRKEAEMDTNLSIMISNTISKDMAEKRLSDLIKELK